MPHFLNIRDRSGNITGGEEVFTGAPRFFFYSLEEGGVVTFVNFPMECPDLPKF